MRISLLWGPVLYMAMAKDLGLNLLRVPLEISTQEVKIKIEIFVWSGIVMQFRLAAPPLAENVCTGPSS
jgi:hypothetical protein